MKDMKRLTSAAVLVPSLALSSLLWIPSCAKVHVDPIKVEPIHVIVDINIRVDRQLDNFFSFEDQFKKPATQPAGPGATGGVK